MGETKGGIAASGGDRSLFEWEHGDRSAHLSQWGDAIGDLQFWRDGGQFHLCERRQSCVLQHWHAAPPLVLARTF